MLAEKAALSPLLVSGLAEGCSGLVVGRDG
jgi:hypothetical protein